jgi:imidazole glycerol-phosphate synthase subunit HisH
MMNVVVVDTGFANYHSVLKAIEMAGAALDHVAVERSRNEQKIRQADKLVMPGQGGFKDCAAAFAEGMGEVILERVRQGTPFFGICLGLQVLFESSEEAPGVRGLGLFPGRVTAIPKEPGLKIPHMGWNRLEAGAQRPHSRWGSDALGRWFYFDHSYHAHPEDESLIVARVSYGTSQITAAIGRDNVFATQFHPEKSQAAGLALLTEFLKA